MTDYSHLMDDLYDSLRYDPTDPAPLWWDVEGAHVLQPDGTYKLIHYEPGDECLCHMAGLHRK